MAVRSTTESAFSHNGQHFANVSTDGRLKIWESESGLAKQEFVPTAHLSTACTCLVWAPLQRQPEQVTILSNVTKIKSRFITRTQVNIFEFQVHHSFIFPHLRLRTLVNMLVVIFVISSKLKKYINFI